MFNYSTYRQKSVLKSPKRTILPLRSHTVLKSPKRISFQQQQKDLMLKTFLEQPIDSRATTTKESESEAELNIPQNLITKPFFPQLMPKKEDAELPKEVCEDWEQRLNRLEKMADMQIEENHMHHLHPRLMDNQPSFRPDPYGRMSIEAIAEMREKQPLPISYPRKGLPGTRKLLVKTKIKSPTRRSNIVYT